MLRQRGEKQADGKWFLPPAERNPPELGLLDRGIKRGKNGRVLLIPASDKTAGHGTAGQATFWKKELAELLQTAPRRAK